MEGAVSSFCKTLMVAISYEDSGIMEYSLWVGGETIVTYNIGEVHLICSQFQGGMLQKILLGNLTSCID